MDTFVKPQWITFTGIDDRTDLYFANALAKKYPIEWGILVSGTNNDARFPSDQGIADMLRRLNGKKAVHFCGKSARRIHTFLQTIDAGWTPKTSAYPIEFDEMFQQAARIQMNGQEPFEGYEYLADNYGLKVIFQARFAVWRKECKFHQLYDPSGGRGQLPSEVPEKSIDGIVGYAGGMGPETVVDYLKMITAQNGEHKFWIDMESRVRTDGWFDLAKVEQVCELVYGDN